MQTWVYTSEGNVDSDIDFIRFMSKARELRTNNRPLSLVLAHPDKTTDDVLLPQSLIGREAICEGFTYRVNCVATSTTLPLKEFIGVPATLEFVTDRGTRRKVSGVIAEASAGDSDGAIASYQIVIRDALAIMEKRVNTRVFRRTNERQIAEILFSEWWRINPELVGTFDFEFADTIHLNACPEREQIWQFNESDAVFLRRLLARAGISWFFRSGRHSQWERHNPTTKHPAHTLVMFSDSMSLEQNAAGLVRYHRQHATEKRDAITTWCAVRRLQPGRSRRYSWDYKQPKATGFMNVTHKGEANQGLCGNSFGASLDEFLVDAPHIGNNFDDLCRLGALRMKRHDLETKCFQGEGGVRDFRPGEYFELTGHPEIDNHPQKEREFVITAVELTARNNLPTGLEARVERLFARSHSLPALSSPDWIEPDANSNQRFHMRFTAVRRTVPIVPAFNPVTDLRDPGLQIAIVVGPENEQIFCDQLGRVKIWFPNTRPADHKHAAGSGASGTSADSAWVRVASNWAGSFGSHCGTIAIPRVGTEVLVAFLGGDPDKPIIVGQLYNPLGYPPRLSDRGALPVTCTLSGIKSEEFGGKRANRLVFDDTNGQISTQLASDDGASQLNLGWLTQPRGGEAAPRGEGAELRSDNAVAVRGAKGVLISASASNSADGKQLDRDELIGLADGLRDIAAQLSKLAEAHSRDPANGPELAELVDKLKNLHHGSNVARSAAGGSSPIVAVSGPAGVVVASQQNLALGAEKNADLITAGNTQLAAGGNTTVRAAEGVSLFTNNGGLKAIAARGKVQIEAQDDQLEMLAKKVVEIISSTDWINIKARQGVRIYGGGSELRISAEGITGYTTGSHQMYAADHQTFPKQARQTEFPDEIPHHDVCIPCMLLAAKAHVPLIDPE